MKTRRAALKVVPYSKVASEKAAMVELVERFNASCIKLSTEDAGMTIAQIAFWSEISLDTIPIMVKIGGPNARNDIKQLLNLPIEGLIAPMVESEYGLENFIEAIKSYATPIQYKRIKKHINIETKVSIEQLDSILESPFAKELDEITLGCSDLSKSMNKSVTDPNLQQVVEKAVQKIRKYGLKVSVGGGISPESIDGLLKKIKPDKFNTRIVTFDVYPHQTYSNAVRHALEFEILMLNQDCSQKFISENEKNLRVNELNKRLFYS